MKWKFKNKLKLNVIRKIQLQFSYKLCVSQKATKEKNVKKTIKGTELTLT